ncbi:MAG: B12-binding domain-containing protein [Paracoccaceae bacterium]
MLTEEEKDALFEAICDGDRETVVDLVTKARDAGEDLGALLKDAMIPAMAEVGDQFSAGEIFVPEMLVAARAMQGGIDIIEPILAVSDHEPLARVCIGSVKGDLHDIGKNLVVMMLKGAGFAVEDLGVDVPNEEFARAVDRGNQVVCLSALLTTTKPQMFSVINHLNDVGKDVKVVIGGAVITQDYADKIGADAFGEDAPGAVKAVKRALGIAA